MKKLPIPLRFTIPVIMFTSGIMMSIVIYSQAASSITFISVLLTFSFFMSLYYYSTITQRIGLLVDATNLFAKGELGARCKLEGSDELAKLANAFNNMADRIQADTERLKKSEERFDLAMRGANDGLWDRDLRSNEIYLSSRWKDMLGYQDHEISNDYSEWKSRVHHEDIDRVMENIAAHLDGKTPHYLCEYRLRHKDGSYRWILSRGLAIRDDECRPCRMAGSHTDITERRNMEEENHHLQAQMLQAQKLESLGVLAGGIAHDFNNLLMSIRGNADLAISKLPESSPARQPLDRITNVVQRAAELSKQMLAYSGKGKFVIENVCLSELVDNMMELLKVSIGKNVSMKCELEKNLAPVEGDATQLRQVIMNLIINASDAIGGKAGTVTVRTGEMECSRAFLNSLELGKDMPEGTYVFIDVTDTGCGMDDEVKTRIFDPFFTTKFAGRGLGLAATHGIIRGHKGGLKVQSRIGEGTSFRMILPKSRKPIEKTQIKTEKSESVHVSGSILVIDDEEEIINVTRLMLESNGYSVMTASDGREGVELYCRNKNSISVVLVDLTMPNMGGEDALREMKKCSEDVKVILTSGYNNEELTSRINSEGFAGYLQKPYGLTDLLDKIQEVLK